MLNIEEKNITKKQIKQEFNETFEDLGGRSFQCRICLEFDNHRSIIQPCRCSGTSQYVHEECLKLWIEKRELFSNGKVQCEICKYEIEYDFAMKLNCRNCEQIQATYREHRCQILLNIIFLPICLGFFSYFLFLIISSHQKITEVQLITFCLLVFLLFGLTVILLIRLIGVYLLKSSASVSKIYCYKKEKKKNSNNQLARVFPQFQFQP